MAPLRRYRPFGLLFQIFFSLLPIAVLVAYKAASDNMKAATKEEKQEFVVAVALLQLPRG